MSDSLANLQMIATALHDLQKGFSIGNRVHREAREYAVRLKDRATRNLLRKEKIRKCKLALELSQNGWTNKEIGFRFELSAERIRQLIKIGRTYQ